MMRRVFVAAAGLFAAACVACSQAIAPPAQHLVGLHPTACAYDNIGMLPVEFANPKNPNFTPVSVGNPPPNIVADINQAIGLAPPFFQRQLCDLDGIFVVPHGQSYGLRNPSTSTGGRYVVLSADLWSGGSAPDLATYEQGVLQTLLGGWNGPSYTPRPHDPAYAAAISILDVLAHEFGHVLFYDSFVNPRGSAPTYNNPAFCGGGYYGLAWSAPPTTPIPWRSETDVDGSHLPDDIQISQILAAPSGPIGKGELLSLFYSEGGSPGHPNGHGRWASLYAGFTPDHDFVETFKLFVLMKSQRPLTTLELNVPTPIGMQHHNIPSSCARRTVLKTKLTCFQQVFCPHTPANACSPVCS